MKISREEGGLGRKEGRVCDSDSDNCWGDGGNSKKYNHGGKRGQ